MSNFKKLLIPAILLVVLVGAYFIVKSIPQEGEEVNEPEEEVIQIYDFVKDEITEVHIENEDESMKFRYTTIQVEKQTTNEDGTAGTELVDTQVWQAVQPERMNVRSSSVDSIAWNANTLKAEKIIEENPSDLSLYGLDKPTKLTFLMKDGTKHILHVGNETPTGEAYYAMKEDAAVVYTIGSYEGKKFLQSRFEMMDTALYEEAFTAVDFSSIRFTRKGEKVFEAQTGNSADWRLTYPIQTEANAENLYTMGTSLSEAEVKEYIAENVTDLSQYGLENPSYILEYTAGGQDYKLSIGKKQPGSDAYYAVFNDKNLVFTVSAGSFTFLDKPIEEIVGFFVHLQNITELRELRVSYKDFTDIVKINVNKEDEDKSTYDFNGTLMTGVDDDVYISAFKKYYQGIIGLNVDKIDMAIQPVLKDPELTIEYTLNSGEKILVELVGASDGVYLYAFKNGEYTGMMVRRVQLADENDYGIDISRPTFLEKLKERTP